MEYRVLTISLLCGTIAGILSAVTLQLMLGLQHLIWRSGDAPLFIFLVVLSGGILLALLQKYGQHEELEDSLALTREARLDNKKRIAVIAASAIIAVGFGASVGPEAGLIAVVAELSALVSAKIARTEQERRVFGEAGNAAALAGFYGSPLGGAWYEEESEDPSRRMTLLAALAGFLSFLWTLKILGMQPQHGLDIPVAQRGDVALWIEAIPAAILGCLAAGVFHVTHHFFLTQRDRLLIRFSAPWIPTIIGSFLLALLLAAVPILRFSGHTEIGELTVLVEQSAWGTLILLALLKAVATALSVVSGWLGGEFFPLAFVGAAMGGVSVILFPGIDPGTAMAAGIVAATVLALRKPMAVVLIMLFLLDVSAIGSLVVAVLIASIVLALMGDGKEKEQEIHVMIEDPQ